MLKPDNMVHIDTACGLPREVARLPVWSFAPQVELRALKCKDSLFASSDAGGRC